MRRAARLIVVFIIVAGCSGHNSANHAKQSQLIEAPPVIETAPTTTTTPPTPLASINAVPLPTTGTANAFAAGIYVDGAPGTPHYFITLGAPRNGTALGTLAFLFQDGSTGEAKTFTTTVVSGVATLIFGRGTATVTAVLGGVAPRSAFEIGECQTIMSNITTRAQCDFRRARSIDG